MIIKNNGKYVRNAEGVVLVPGSNEVDEDSYEKLEAHPIIKHLMEKNEIEVAKASSTKELNANEAIDMVEDTWNVSLLEGWAEKEDRSTVTKAIEKQIEAVKGEADGEDEE